MTDATATQTSKLPLWLIALVFTIPFILATLLYLFKDQLNLKTTQHGEFIKEPFEISFYRLFNLEGEIVSPDTLVGKWSIIYLSPFHCDDNCQKIKQKLHKMQIALKRYRNLFRVVATPSHLLLTKRNIGYQALMLSDNHVIILDPNGHAMMHYPQDTNPLYILKDMQKLIKLGSMKKEVS